MISIRIAGLLAASASVTFAPSALAQDRPTADARWLAWVDCWQPQAAPTSLISMVGETPTLCVVPAAGAAAVDMMSVVNGAITSRERIDATGARIPFNADGCEGWKSAAWSPDGERLYLRSESTCEGGLVRRSNGLLAMVSQSEWVDVQSVSVGERTTVRVLRYVQAPVGLSVPDEIASALTGRRLAAATARIAAASDITHADIVDAVAHVDSPVIEAWLLERRPSMTVNAKQLVQLADAGVPERVLDLVVALANGDKFTIDAAERVAVAIPDTVVGRSALSYDPFVWSGMYNRYGRYSPYSMYGYSPYGMYGYSPYGYYPYGYGYYYNTRPVVVVVTPPTDPGGEPAAGRARAVKGRGYTRSGSAPRDPPSTRTGRTGSDGGSASGGSSGGSSSGGSSSGGGSSGGGRTAKPRTPPPSA